MFELAFSKRMPALTHLVARLHVSGKGHMADKIVTTLILSGKVYQDQLKDAFTESTGDEHLKKILEELSEAS